MKYTPISQQQGEEFFAKLAAIVHASVDRSKAPSQNLEPLTKSIHSWLLSQPLEEVLIMAAGSFARTSLRALTNGPTIKTEGLKGRFSDVQKLNKTIGSAMHGKC